MPHPRFPWPMGDKRSGGPLLGPGGPPELFSWDAETSQELPDTSTFTRASTAQVLTTTDGTTFWYQEAKPGELRLDGLRRVENELSSDLSLWTPASGGAGITPTVTQNFAPGVDGGGNTATRVQYEAGGTDFGDFSRLGTVESGVISDRYVMSASMKLNSGTSEQLLLIDRANNTKTITVTDTWQRFAFNGEALVLTLRFRIDARGDVSGAGPIDVLIDEDPDYPVMLELVQDSSDTTGGRVDFGTTYNVNVAGVRYFNTTNANSVDGSGVVTEATGTTITSGGYLPEPAATFQVTQSEDLSDVSWTKDGVTESDQGITDIGLRTWRIDAGTGTSAHRIFKTYSGTGDASLRVRAKAVTGQFLVLRAGLAAQTSSVFDLINGNITQTGASTSATTIEDLGGGWYECTVAKPSGLAQQSYALFAISDTGTPASDSPSFTGANETIDLAISAGEDTLFSTTSEPTAASTVTRVADVLDSGAAIASEFGALFDFTAPDAIGTGNTISLLGAATSAVDILRLDASFNVIMDDGGTPTTIGTVAGGQRFKISYGRDATGRSASLDGATVVTGDAPSAVHEGENFQLYSTASVNQARGRGHLSTLYSVRPSDSDLEGLSS